MPKIETLVEDIDVLLRSGFKPSPRSLETLCERLSERVGASFRDRKANLSISNLGTPCRRKLWYNLHSSERKEELSSAARIKFLYGDILEQLVLWLAEEAGHKVEGQQDTLNLYGIKGHRDAVIDGVLVDVKSASPRSYQKFLHGLTKAEDSFGYLVQLDSYLEASKNDPIVVDKDHAAFLAIDKTLGNITLDVHEKQPTDYPAYIDEVRKTLDQPRPPARPYPDEPFGKSGNKKLGTVCRYCEHKFTCWPSVRVFEYSNGYEYLTEVNKEPKVPEYIRGTELPTDEDTSPILNDE